MFYELFKTCNYGQVRLLFQEHFGMAWAFTLYSKAEDSESLKG